MYFKTINSFNSTKIVVKRIQSSDSIQEGNSHFMRDHLRIEFVLKVPVLVQIRNKSQMIPTSWRNRSGFSSRDVGVDFSRIEQLITAREKFAFELLLEFETILITREYSWFEIKTNHKSRCTRYLHELYYRFWGSTWIPRSYETGLFILHLRIPVNYVSFSKLLSILK